MEAITKRIFTNCDTIVRKKTVEVIADEILALPLDVPSDEEIKDESINNITEALESVLPNDGNYIITDENKLRAVYFYFQFGAIWMRTEILKRNK